MFNINLHSLGHAITRHGPAFTYQIRSVWSRIEDQLTHWGRVTHICVGKLAIIGSDNGLSPGRRQAIIWTNAGILIIGPLGTNFSEILIVINTFSFKKMHLKMSSAKWRPFCLGLNELTLTHLSTILLQQVSILCYARGLVLPGLTKTARLLRGRLVDSWDAFTNMD